MTSPQPPHRHRSRAAKRAAKKIASRSTSQQAKREARKKKFHNHKSSSNKRTFVALETKKTKGKAHRRHVRYAKNSVKANKRTTHGGHTVKTKVHWARLSQSQCHGQCASANMKELNAPASSNVPRQTLHACSGVHSPCASASAAAPRSICGPVRVLAVVVGSSSTVTIVRFPPP